MESVTTSSNLKIIRHSYYGPRGEDRVAWNTFPYEEWTAKQLYDRVVGYGELVKFFIEKSDTATLGYVTVPSLARFSSDDGSFTRVSHVRTDEEF